MTDINPENAVLTELLFGVGGIIKQMETVEAIANRTALTVKQAFAQTELGAPINTSQMTAQQAMVQRILAEGETNKARIMAEGEAQISQIQAKESLTRQQIAQKEAATQLAITKQQMEQERLLYMQSRRESFENMPTGMGGLLLRHASWFATGAVLFEGFELLKTSISDVSASMTKLQQVLEIVPPYDKSPAKLAADLNELKEVAGVMATAYGVEFSKVLDVMSQAGRRFKDVASIISATDTALQLVVVDAVPLETAIGSVEAIMSQFGLTTGQSKQALFEISAAAHMLQINATDLLQAIQRSGSAFKTMKADTKEAVAAISVLAQMTAQKGGMIGNAWKSLEASFASKKGQDALKELGIQLFDNTGTIRDMSTVLVELQEKWKGLSDQSKMHYATTLAGGKFHYQRLQAFLDDYTGAYQKALKGIESANADMQKKLVEAAMVSLPQQMRMTQASFQVLSAELTQDATPALIMFLTSVREGINILKDHDDELRVVLSTGVKLAEGYIAWKIAVWAYTTATTSATVQTMALQGSLLRLELTGKGVPATMAAISGSVGGVAAVAAAAAKKVLLLVAAFGALDRLTGTAMDPKGQKVKDLQAQLDDVQSQMTGWQPGKNLVKSGGDLLSGHFVESANHLFNAGLGWLPMADAAKEKMKAEETRIKTELKKAQAERKKETEEALTRDLIDLETMMEKYEREANEKTTAALAAAGLGPDGQPINDTGGSPGGSSKAKEIDYVSEALGRLADSSKQFELANLGMESTLSTVNNLFDVAGAEYDYLNSRIEAGTATMADHARMQELVGTRTALLKNEQLQLTGANQKYQQEIDALNPLLAKATAEYERFKAAGDEEHMEDAADAVSSLKSEIDSLSGSIASNTQEIWANKGALDQLANSAYSAYYQQTMDWMKHMEAVGQMNNELQAKILAGFDDQQLTQRQRWQKEEDQFQNRLERLQEERDAIKDAYDERMEQYEAEIEANDQLIESREKAIDTFKESIDSQIAEIQRLMDALDDEGDKEDKEEAARQHNKKLAELQEKRLYHELRTGTEHVDAIADIDKQIAEENIAWQLQQNDWARDAQKEAYQDQIDALRDQAKKHEDSARKEIDSLKKTNNAKKQEMQSYYKQIESLLSDHTLDMLASLGSANESMYQKGLDWMRNLAQGIKDGQTELPSGFDDFVSDVETSHSNLPSDSSTGRPTAPTYPTQRTIATVSPGQYINEGGRTYMKSQDLAGLLGKSVDWDGSNVIIGGKKFSPYKNVNGRTYVGIREVAEALGYSVNWDASSGLVSILDKAHDGAKVLRDGAAFLRHDERVLSPNLAPSFDRLAMAITRTPDFSKFSFSNDNTSLERKLDAVIAVMKSRQMVVDKAVNIEHVSFEDRADMQAFGVETRSILSAMG